MKVILENTETGELRELYNQGNFIKPWRVKEVVPEQDHKTYELQAELAVWATKTKLPIPQLLDAARWLLHKHCPYCELGTQVLKRLNELGDERTIDLINRILIAKEANDTAVLQQIRQEINGE